MRHDSGLAASPPVRDTLGVERRRVLSFRFSAVDGQALGEASARRDRGPGKISRFQRMQPPNEEFFTLFSEAGSNIVERAAIPLAAHHGAEASP
jgi:hypothetical protein